MSLWRVALGRAVWRAALGHVGSAYWRTMIGGVLAVVKGGFSRSFAPASRHSRVGGNLARHWRLTMSRGRG